MSSESSYRIGKEFQTFIRKILKEIGRYYAVDFQEFVDTGQAGNVVKEQPSDFEIRMFGGKMAFLEIKASRSKKRMTRQALQPGQKKYIEISRRLKIPYLIIFKSSLNEVHFVNGHALMKGERSSYGDCLIDKLCPRDNPEFREGDRESDFEVTEEMVTRWLAFHLKLRFWTTTD